MVIPLNKSRSQLSMTKSLKKMKTSSSPSPTSGRIYLETP